MLLLPLEGRQVRREQRWRRIEFLAHAERPVSRSVTSVIFSTAPCASKRFRSSVSTVVGMNIPPMPIPGGAERSSVCQNGEEEDSQEPSDRHEGWRYFLEKADLKAGTDPIEATQKRQMRTWFEVAAP